MDWLEYENKNIARGFLNICGVDEAGRGPLAGPVCAAAVILPENTVIEGVNDSKKLSEKRTRWKTRIMGVYLETGLMGAAQRVSGFGY